MQTVSLFFSISEHLEVYLSASSMTSHWVRRKWIHSVDLMWSTSRPGVEIRIFIPLRNLIKKPKNTYYKWLRNRKPEWRAATYTGKKVTEIVKLAGIVLSHWLKLKFLAQANFTFNHHWYSQWHTQRYRQGGKKY